MDKVLSLLVTILLLQSLPASSHGLMPSRLEAPSGSKLIAYRFTALNNYPQTEQFTVECFKSDLNHPYACKFYPQIFNIAPKKTRKIRVQISPDEDAVYLVCTIQTKQEGIVTRVCSRFGVGVPPSVPPNRNRVGKSTKHASLSPGAGQGKSS